MNDEDFEKILTTVNPVEIATIKSLLDKEGLREGLSYYFKGEYLVQWFALMGPATLMVRRDCIERAKQLLEKI